MRQGSRLLSERETETKGTRNLVNSNGAKCLSLTDIELGLLIESEPLDEEPLLLFTIDCPWTASFNKARCLFRFCSFSFHVGGSDQRRGDNASNAKS